MSGYKECSCFVLFCLQTVIPEALSPEKSSWTSGEQLQLTYFQLFSDYSVIIGHSYPMCTLHCAINLTKCSYCGEKPETFIYHPFWVSWRCFCVIWNQTLSCSWKASNSSEWNSVGWFVYLSTVAGANHRTVILRHCSYGLESFYINCKPLLPFLQSTAGQRAGHAKCACQPDTVHRADILNFNKEHFNQEIPKYSLLNVQPEKAMFWLTVTPQSVVLIMRSPTLCYATHTTSWSTWLLHTGRN